MTWSLHIILRPSTMFKNKILLHGFRQVLSLMLVSTPLLNGCAATGQSFSGFQSPPAESAVIVVYRPDLFRAGGQSVRIAVDNKEIGVLRNAGWLSIPVIPGERAITLEERYTFFQGGTALVVKTREGESIALRVLPGGMTGIYPISTGPVLTFGPWTIQQVSNELAQAELKNLKESK